MVFFYTQYWPERASALRCCIANVCNRQYSYSTYRKGYRKTLMVITCYARCGGEARMRKRTVVHLELGYFSPCNAISFSGSHLTLYSVSSRADPHTSGSQLVYSCLITGRHPLPCLYIPARYMYTYILQLSLSALSSGVAAMLYLK